MRRVPFRSALAAVCLLAALLRVTAFAATGRFTNPEVWESETIATNLLEGRGFTFPTLGVTYRSYMEPLYPGLCAAVYAITGHAFWVMAVVQIALGTALVAFGALCARRVLSPEASLAAAGLIAVHPGLILYTTKFHPFVLDTFLWFATFAGVFAFSPRRPRRSAVIAGALLGASVLTRPTILVCLPILAWWIWRRSTDAPRARAGHVLAFIAGAAVVIAPWTARNYAVHHRLMLTRSGTAFVLWLGNNPYLFTGSAMAPDGGDLIDEVPASVHAELAGRDELAQQDYFAAEAADYIRRDPLGFVSRWARKFMYFWWFSPQAGMLYSVPLFRIYQILEAMVLALAAAGAAICWRRAREDVARREAVLVMVLCCLVIAALQSVYYVEGRHRLAIEPFLLIFAAAPLALAVRARWAHDAATVTPGSNT